MNDNNSKGISYTAGFFMLIAFAVAGLIMSVFIGKPIWENMTGQSFENFETSMTNPSYARAYQFMQGLNAVVGYLFPALLTAYLLNNRPGQLLGFSPQILPIQAGLTIVITLTAMAISIFALAYLNHEIPLPAEWKITADKLEADYGKQVQAIVRLQDTGDYIIALIVMAFLPALCEEALFRGGLQNFLTRATGKPWLSIFAVSLIFSLVHFSFYGFIPRLFLGAVLGYIYYYSGKLWLSILAHFINNALAITVLYTAVKEGTPLSEAVKEGNNAQWWGILLLPALVGIFSLFKKVSAVEKSVAENKD